METQDLQGRIVLARLMESQIWHWPASSLALWGSRGSEKGHRPLPTLLSGRKLSPSFCLDAKHLSLLVFQPEVMGTYLPGTGTPSWRLGVGLGLLALEISLLTFYPPHVSVGPAFFTSVFLLQVSILVVSLIL